MQKQTKKQPPKKKVKTTHTPSSNPPTPLLPSVVPTPVMPPTSFSLGTTPISAPVLTTPTPVLSQTAPPPVLSMGIPPLPVKYKPKYTKASTKSKKQSKHFGNVSLPPRQTRKDTMSDYGGLSGTESQFKKIHKKAKRSGLPDSLTTDLRQQAKDKLKKGLSVTKEERDMAASSKLSLSKAGAQRNHVFASENTLVPYSAGLSVLTTHGTSQQERDDAIKHMKTIGKTLTGGDLTVEKEIGDLLDEVDSDTEPSEAAKLVSKLAQKTADHSHNIDLGHGGKNMSMSNRTDVMTSPGRTSISEKDYHILDGLEDPLKELLGDTMATNLLTVPMSPGGTHIMSSKRHDK